MPVDNMTSKANITLSVFLVSVAIFANIIRLKVSPKSVLGYHNDSLLNFTELSGRHGFTSEQHTVLTEDGYILTIFRMRSKDCKQLKRPPVILMHGLLLSSDAWLDAGPQAGLPYLLADACYDLWVGNQRGNYYARRHVRLHPDRDPQFWQFSVDEIGYYDIPAIIDYILKNTSEKKLNYIGYSQGAGTFFIMCSERPGYCDKVNILIGLAPAARQTHTRSVTFRLFTESVNKVEDVLTSIGVHEIFAQGALSQEFLAFLCKFAGNYEICDTFNSLIDSSHPGSIVDETIQVLYGHFPAGTSTHNIARYGQSMQTEKFQKFDYGRARNLNIYGDENPPSFNLSAVTVPFVTLYGKNDYLVDAKDLVWLVKKLPNVLEAIEIADPQWNHFDMIYSQYIKQMVYPIVNQYLLKHSKNQKKINS